MPVTGARRPDRRSLWLTIISVACILLWAVPALMMLDRGFSIANEGSYVLSYRFWHSNPYFEAGSQYLYGPVFRLLGDSIPLIRLLRLVMVVGANALFAWSFLGWLEEQGSTRLPASKGSLAWLLTAAGGMSYLWAPLTPGYYDLTADCTLALAALMFLALRRGPAPPWWIGGVSGLLGVALLVTKWTGCLVVVVALVVVLHRLLQIDRGRPGPALRYLGAFIVGALVGLGAFWIYAVPLPRFVSILWQVSRLTASGTHGLGYLIAQDIRTPFLTLAGAVLAGWPLALGLVGARTSSRQGRELAAGRWVLGSAIVTLLVPFALGWHGGAALGTTVIDVAFAGLLAAGAAACWSWIRTRGRGDTSVRWVAWSLFLLPLLQAAGSNVSLSYVSVECLAMWMALVLLAAARDQAPPVVSAAVVAYLGVAAVATALICGTTTLLNPYKATAFSDDTVTVPGLGVRLSPQVASQDEALRDALGPYVVNGVTPVLTLDKAAGLGYLVGGAPAGSTWTEPDPTSRTAGILTLACQHGDLQADRPPVLIIDRAVDPLLARAMAGCGFPFPSTYRPLTVPGGPPGMRVYVPRS